MSNRSSSSSSHHKQERSNNHSNNSNRGHRGKTQQRFIPKTSPSPTTNPATLSFSLRHHSSSGVSPAVHGSSAGDSSRLRLGENGDWFSRKGNFVNYLPQDEALAIGLGADEGGLDAVESQRVVDLLNRELARLLKLKPRDFWREVASDTSLHGFLDSFLQFRSRWYDFPFHGAKGSVAGVVVGDLELSRRVFMVLYRISSNRDPGVRGSESLSKKDHEVLLQDKKLLDLPKLLDVCAVYGHENEELTRSLVVNAINAQPDILESLIGMMSHFLGIVHTMYQRCTASLEVMISSGGFKDHGSSQQHIEFLEVMDFLNDAVVSMDTFVSLYRPAAVFFSCPVDVSHGNEELINVLATLHDSLLPALQQGLQIILPVIEKTSAMLSDVSVSLKSLSTRIVDLGWKLLEGCYLSDELFTYKVSFPSAMKIFPASIEDSVIRADILIQTFKEITAVPQHAQCRNFGGTYLQKVERKYQILPRIQSLQQAGWLSIDDEQYKYLAGLMSHPNPPAPKRLSSAPNSVRTDGMQVEEDEAIAESKISQVKDLFPDCGKGFILACLEVYDHNPEEVIQRILEGTLHEDLLSLDTSMETLPSKPTPKPVKQDKGKGILVESARIPATNTSGGPQIPTPVANPSSLPSSAGRFIRKAKGDQHHDDALGSKDEKHMEKTAALSSQYEYEDEYDDSFDDLGLTIVESGSEAAEAIGEKVKSSMNSRGESQSSGHSAARWNTRKKPQYYVKDGKNYSYKVEGSIAVADQHQASLLTQAQKEVIHGLGRGGNRPLGAVKQLLEQDESIPPEMDSGESTGRGRGRGRGGRGGGRNHNRKDRAMKKHMVGLGGF